MHGNYQVNVGDLQTKRIPNKFVENNVENSYWLTWTKMLPPKKRKTPKTNSIQKRWIFPVFFRENLLTGCDFDQRSAWIRSHKTPTTPCVYPRNTAHVYILYVYIYIYILYSCILYNTLNNMLVYNQYIKRIFYWVLSYYF